MNYAKTAMLFAGLTALFGAVGLVLAGGAVDKLFSTHPSTANRVAALRAMAGELASAKPTVGRFAAARWTGNTR